METEIYIMWMSFKNNNLCDLLNMFNFYWFIFVIYTIYIQANTTPN